MTRYEMPGCQGQKSLDLIRSIKNGSFVMAKYGIIALGSQFKFFFRYLSRPQIPEFLEFVRESFSGTPDRL